MMRVVCVCAINIAASGSCHRVVLSCCGRVVMLPCCLVMSCCRRRVWSLSSCRVVLVVSKIVVLLKFVDVMDRFFFKHSGHQ